MGWIKHNGFILPHAHKFYATKNAFLHWCYKILKVVPECVWWLETIGWDSSNIDYTPKYLNKKVNQALFWKYTDFYHSFRQR